MSTVESTYSSCGTHPKFHWLESGNVSIMSWMMVSTHLKKMSQLGWWHSQYMEKYKACSSHHQPVSCLLVANHRLKMIRLVQPHHARKMAMGPIASGWDVAPPQRPGTSSHDYISKTTRNAKRLHNYGKIHHFQWENSLFLWSFSIATLKYQRVNQQYCSIESP